MDDECSVGSNFVSFREQILKALVRMIIESGCALNMGARPYFVQTIKALNPNFRKVKQRIVVREANKEFKHLKMDLNSTFASLDHKIALACDIWQNEKLQSFICITAHWIDRDWKMHRRIINFKRLNYRTPAGFISRPVLSSVNAWGIKRKTISITVDDDCDCDDDVADIKNVINPILDGNSFRVRCACRVLNSCVQIGLKHMSKHLTRIREVIARQNYDGDLFKFLSEKRGLKPRLMFDDEVRWDSTRDMLKNCMLYKDVLAEFIASLWPRNNSMGIREKDYAAASLFCKFLDVFYEAVDYVSGNYHPSSCGILIHLVNIAKLFSEHRRSAFFKHRISFMEETFLKHYERIPDLYYVAAVMDPRIKLSGCECLLESFYQCTRNTKVNVEEEKIRLNNLVNKTYNLYVSKSRKITSSSSLASDFAWLLISQKRQKTSDPAFNELTIYLQTPHHEFSENETKDFDILGWWKNHEVVYPVLSNMARDLVTIPVSTMAPDWAFVVNEWNWKVILDKSKHLSGRKLEIYRCLKDWFHAEGRKQGEREPYNDGSMIQLPNWLPISWTKPSVLVS